MTNHGSKYGSKRCLGRTEVDRKIISEPRSSKQRSKKGPGRPLFGVNAVVCSKEKKSDKNAEKKQKKDLTGPTLLEISEYPTNRAIEPPRLHGEKKDLRFFLVFPENSRMCLRQ